MNNNIKPLSLFSTANNDAPKNKKIFFILLSYNAKARKNISKIENEYSPK